MSFHRFNLYGEASRARARRIVDAAPNGYAFEVREPRRSDEQNAKMWAMLSDVSMSQPGGRKHPPETWKALFMHACGYEAQFEMGLNGQPFPTGFRSSRMSKAQMADLITFIQMWGDEHGVEWTEKEGAA